MQFHNRLKYYDSDNSIVLRTTAILIFLNMDYFLFIEYMNVHEELNNRAIRMVELIIRVIRYTYVIGILEIHSAGSRNLNGCL